MFSDEVLLALQELVRRVPGLAAYRIRYTRSALRMTTNLPDEDGAAAGSTLLFLLLGLSLIGLLVAGASRSWGFLAAGLLIDGGLIYWLSSINRQVNNSRSLPPDFIVDAATRRITLPASGTWWATAAAPACSFEQVADIQPKRIQAYSGDGELLEMAELTLRLTGGYPQTVLTLGSYAVAEQLAVVLRLIVYAPAATEA